MVINDLSVLSSLSSCMIMDMLQRQLVNNKNSFQCVSRLPKASIQGMPLVSVLPAFSLRAVVRPYIMRSFAMWYVIMRLQSPCLPPCATTAVWQKVILKKASRRREMNAQEAKENIVVPEVGTIPGEDNREYNNSECVRITGQFILKSDNYANMIINGITDLGPMFA